MNKKAFILSLFLATGVSFAASPTDQTMVTETEPDEEEESGQSENTPAGSRQANNPNQVAQPKNSNPQGSKQNKPGPTAQTLSTKPVHDEEHGSKKKRKA